MSARVEVVRGRLEPAVADELVAFWSGHGALQEAAARARLAEVVAVLRDPDGAIAGANSVFADRVELIGGRRFWIYRSFLAPGHAASAPAMMDAAYATLAEEFAATGEGPIGLVVIVDPGAYSPPEVVWPGPSGFMYMGRGEDRRETRAAYFDGAVIGPGQGAQGEDDPQLGPGMRIEPFAEQDTVSDEDVIELWTRETQMPIEEARRRILEVQLVGIHDEHGVVGVSSAYLRRNAQLDMQLWYYRAFVAAKFRLSSMAILLALRGRDRLKQRFLEGIDTRAAGMIYEVENPGLKTHFNRALWLPTQFMFIGENAKGDHVRVHWFPGARTPGSGGG